MTAPTNQRQCRGCGCTDQRACPGGCSWVLLDVETPTGICSECAFELEWNGRALIEVGLDGDFPLANPAEPPPLVVERRRILLP